MNLPNQDTPKFNAGPLGRLGLFVADHRRGVILAWIAVAITAGIFAPRVEHALSGAGWEATGSESVAARDVIDREFGGLSSYALQVVVHSESKRIGDPEFDAAVTRVEEALGGNPATSKSFCPSPAFRSPADRHTAVVQAGAGADPNRMVEAAAEVEDELDAGQTGDVEVLMSGAAGMWSDFNKANREAMLKSELISWPVTLGILVLAFGSLIAAGLPLMLTITGLVAAAGSLYLGTQFLDISIWAMNFALMFALALGIDYALFIVYRFRAALDLDGMSPRDATGLAIETAGKAVLFSGITVLISLSAVMLVPSPAFRSMSLGIMLAVIFVLAASLTLLPAVLAALGPRIDRLSLGWVEAERKPFNAIRCLGRTALATTAPLWRDCFDDPRRLGGSGLAPRHRHAIDQGCPN